MVGLFVVGCFPLLRALSRPGLSWVLRVKARATHFGESSWSRSCRGRHVGCGVRSHATGAHCLRSVSSKPHAVGLSGVTLLPELVWPAVHLLCMGAWLSCCRQHYAWPVLLPWRRMRRLIDGLSCCRVCWAIGGRLRLCGGARTLSWRVLCWCVTHLMAGRGVVVYGPPHGGACCVGVRPPHGGACCLGVWPPSWLGVVWWCMAPHMVGHALVVCGPPHGGARCGGVWPRAWWGMVWWRVAPCWWGVVWWCVAPLMVGRAALVCDPLYGGACCAGLRCVVLCGVVCCGGVWALRGGACCVGVWPPSWWGVVCCVLARHVAVCYVALCCVVWWWCVALLMVGRAALVFGHPHGGACCVGVRCVVLCGIVCCGGVWLPSRWGVVWWCVAPLMVRHGVLCYVALQCVVLLWVV